MDRRSFLRASALGAGATFVGVRYLGFALPSAHAADGPYGPLRGADGNGIELPSGFTSRVVARSGQVVPGTSYSWHAAPDGGACFPVAAGGWVYVSNSELGSGAGGAGALRFNADGSIHSAYRILSGTSRNCAGGSTPWGTWLSCEENGSLGRVWECDPMGGRSAVVHSAMGSFNHEAAACDPVRQVVYLTEDAGSGKLRRFRPTTWGDLSTGVLEAAVVSGSEVGWTTSISNGTSFNGGEGAWYADGKVWFTTKGDNRVWELDVASTPSKIRVIYDDNSSPNPVLTGVDNIVGSVSGDLLVAEDGGNMELVLIEPSGAVSVFMRVLDQSGSELAGPAFSPDGSRLYVSSQRGGNGSGISYEIAGPFRTTGGGTTTTTTTTTTTVPGGISLRATRYKVKGAQHVDLTWSGAGTADVIVSRNGTPIATTPNDGAYTDRIGAKGGGSYTYQACETDGGACSNTVTVTF